MSKQPSKPAASIKSAPKQTPAPAQIDDDDAITIVAKPSRASGGGAIDQVRKHLVSNPEASLEDLTGMLAASGHKLSDGTIRMTRTQTLAILRFIKALQAGEKTTTIEGVNDATRYYVVRHPQASIESISSWLKSKGCEATPNVVKATRSATLAVLAVAA